MARTTVGLVSKILAGNRGTFNGQLADLQQCIDDAHLLINQVVALQTKKLNPVTLVAANYEMMERWLAAYNYTQIDPLQTNTSTEGASGGYVAEKLDPNRYKNKAIQADPSGVLNALLNRLFAHSAWMGTPNC